MASVLITYLNIENRLDRQYDYDDGQSVLTYILVFSLIWVHVCVVVSFNICFARQSCVAQVDCFCFFTILLFGIRQTDNLFIQFASKKLILSW